MIISFNRHGANVDRKNKYGETPLHVACFFGDERIVEMLLKYGSNVDEQNNNGFTPLHKATYNGHEKVIQLLLDYHANRYIRNHGSFNPREIAFNRGNKGCFPKAKNKFINFFLVFLYFQGQTEIVNLLGRSAFKEGMEAFGDNKYRPKKYLFINFKYDVFTVQRPNGKY